MLNQLEHTLRLQATAETKVLALQKILKQVSRLVSREFSGVPVRIEPLEIQVLQASVKQYRERFLGILFPRTRSQYFLCLEVKVRLVIAELDQIDFKLEQDNRSTLQRAAELRF